MAARKPKFDDVIDNVRVRVYATRSEYEVIFNDDDIEDRESDVRCYPKLGEPSAWARQARLEYRSVGGV